MPFFVSTTYQFNDEGTDDYQIGNSWLTNVGVVYPISSKVGISTQINMRVAAADTAHSHNGDAAESEHAQRTGGTFVYLSPGLQVSLTDNLWSYATVQFPLYQRVNVIQLTSDTNVKAGISYKFKAW